MENRFFMMGIAAGLLGASVVAGAGMFLVSTFGGGNPPPIAPKVVAGVSSTAAPTAEPASTIPSDSSSLKSLAVPPAPQIVREYPEKDAAGDVYVVQHWSDDHYSKRLVEKGQSLPPAPTPTPIPLVAQVPEGIASTVQRSEVTVHVYRHGWFGICYDPGQTWPGFLVGSNWQVVTASAVVQQSTSDGACGIGVEFPGGQKSPARAMGMSSVVAWLEVTPNSGRTWNPKSAVPLATTSASALKPGDPIWVEGLHPSRELVGRLGGTMPCVGIANGMAFSREPGKDSAPGPMMGLPYLMLDRDGRLVGFLASLSTDGNGVVAKACGVPV